MKVLQKILIVLTIFLVLLFFILLKTDKVDTSLTQEDIEYIPKYMGVNVSNVYDLSYEEQLIYIRTVQHSVLNVASEHKAIPLGQFREPKDLFYKKFGYCYDRSRTIGKMLKKAGFQTRQIFLIAKKW